MCDGGGKKSRAWHLGAPLAGAAKFPREFYERERVVYYLERLGKMLNRNTADDKIRGHFCSLNPVQG